MDNRRQTTSTPVRPQTPDSPRFTAGQWYFVRGGNALMMTTTEPESPDSVVAPVTPSAASSDFAVLHSDFDSWISNGSDAPRARRYDYTPDYTLPHLSHSVTTTPRTPKELQLPGTPSTVASEEFQAQEFQAQEFQAQEFQAQEFQEPEQPARRPVSVPLGMRRDNPSDFLRRIEQFCLGIYNTKLQLTELAEAWDLKTIEEKLEDNPQMRSQVMFFARASGRLFRNMSGGSLSEYDLALIMELFGDGTFNHQQRIHP